MTLVALMAMIVGFTFILANREGLEEDKVNVGLALGFTVIMGIVFGIQFFRKFFFERKQEIRVRSQDE